MAYFGLSAITIWFAVLSLTSVQEAPSVSDFGSAQVEKVYRVDSDCRIYCDIASWPAVIGKEIAVEIRGLQPQQNFSPQARQFLLDTLHNALKAPAGDPNQPSGQRILLCRIQRGPAFCLIADIQVSGKDLGQMLVEKGYAKKIIVPQDTAPAENPTSPAVTQSPRSPSPAPAQTAPAEGFIAAKSGKVFHKPTCSHAKRIQDKARITFTTRDEAVASGRRPCQTCKP